MSDKEAILVRIEALDQRQDERHEDLKERISKLESRLDRSEEWRNQQIGQSRTIGAGVAAFVSLAINMLRDVFTGRA